MVVKATAAKENWSGQSFANNWEILEKYNCAQSKALGLGGKNVHYRVFNHSCGVETYMERTTIGDAIEDKRSTMGKCNGCINGSKLKTGSCHYSTKVREKPLYKVPDRSEKIEIGKDYGNFYVKDIQPAKKYADNQCRATIVCRWCGAEQESRFDHVLNCSVACECFKNHSSGEKIVQEWLIAHNIPHKAEETFSDLYGIGGGSLRYDFSILDEQKRPIKLIEVDGDQHFEDAGSFYNPDGRVQIHDNMKNQYAQEHKIPLLRIPYTQLLDLDNIIPDFLLSA